MESEIVKVKITKNRFDINLEEIFLIAERENQKRRFLFVSKVLGKHLEIRPDSLFSIGRFLAFLTQEKLKGYSSEPNIENDFLNRQFSYEGNNSLFIGFAETATALGQVVFQNFNNSYYGHTTRKVLDDITPTLMFEEEHSHAVEQVCYINKTYFKNNETIVLIDDEITTGKTSLNIINQISEKYPLNRVIIVSILNWLSEEDKEKIILNYADLNIELDFVSLIEGEILLSKNEPLMNYVEKEKKHEEDIKISSMDITFYKSKHMDKRTTVEKHFHWTGRFGLTESDQYKLVENAKNEAEVLSKLLKDEKTLCVGTGEFMYIPLLISYFISPDITFKSTTRSPILPYDLPNYPIHSRARFLSLEDGISENYIYNLDSHRVNQVVLFLEKLTNDFYSNSLIKTLERAGVVKLIVVYFDEGE